MARARPQPAAVVPRGVQSQYPGGPSPQVAGALAKAGPKHDQQVRNSNLKLFRFSGVRLLPATKPHFLVWFSKTAGETPATNPCSLCKLLRASFCGQREHCDRGVSAADFGYGLFIDDSAVSRNDGNVLGLMS